MKTASAAIGPAVTDGPAKPRGRAADQYTVAEIVSKALASIVGGGVVTYWVGAAVAAGVVRAHLLIPTEAVYLAGMVQICVFTGVVIWVCASSSIARMWIGLAVVTGLSVAVAEIGPKLPAPRAAADAAGAQGAGAPGPGRLGRGAGRRGPPGAAASDQAAADVAGPPGAGAARAGGGPNAGQGRGGGRQMAMLAALDLDAGQQAKAAQIFADARQKAQAGADADPAARGAAFRQANLAALGQIEAILRPDQKARFAAVREQMQSGGFGRGGGAGRRGPPDGGGGGAPADSSGQ